MSEKRCKEGKPRDSAKHKFVCSKCELTANKKEKLCKPNKKES